MTRPILEFKKFKGVCNTTDPLRIPPGYLAIAHNVDIDDENMLHRRLGYTVKYSGNCHSLWSNGSVCLFVKSGTLYSLDPDLSTTTVLKASLGDNRMEYVDTEAMVVFTNDEIIGYVHNNTAYAFPTPTQEFKEKMVGGQLLEWYNSRLYAAQGNILFYSDAVAPMVMDSRHNFISLPGTITMLKSVSDGLYVSTGSSVAFLGGRDPGDMVYSRVTDSPAIKGMSSSVDGEEVGRGVLGRCAIWASEDGIFVGLPGGAVREVSQGNYSLTGATRGASFLGSPHGFYQFISSYEFLPDSGQGTIGADVPLPTISITE